MDDVHAKAVQRTMRESLSSLGDFDRRFGRYPYPELDVVLGDFTGFGGMEYPTLVMSQQWGVAVTHEIAHQWWYGLVGDDQYHAPWLDEAFATWSEARHDGVAGRLCRNAHWPDATARVTFGMDYFTEHPRDYGAVVYGEGACALQALSDVLGQARFDRLLRAYVADHRFGWSTTQDFKTAAQAAASQLSPPVDLDSFWADHRID
jgi:aminopeptidase N